jgi:hypothetical protein
MEKRKLLPPPRIIVDQPKENTFRSELVLQRKNIQKRLQILQMTKKNSGALVRQ